MLSFSNWHSPPALRRTVEARDLPPAMPHPPSFCRSVQPPHLMMQGSEALGWAARMPKHWRQVRNCGKDPYKSRMSVREAPGTLTLTRAATPPEWAEIPFGGRIGSRVRRSRQSLHANVDCRPLQNSISRGGRQRCCCPHDGTASTTQTRTKQSPGTVEVTDTGEAPQTQGSSHHQHICYMAGYWRR